MSISLSGAKKSLAGVWFLGFGIPFLILLVRTVQPAASSQTDDMWNWFLPTVFPTLSLIIGVLISDFKNKPDLSQPADTSLFLFAFCLSALYLMAVFATLVMSPLQPGETTGLLKRSHIYLAPTQGLTAGCLAVFFRK